MTPPRIEWSGFPPVTTTVGGLAWLALFSLLFTLGAENGAWPRLALAGLRDLELAAGFLAGAAVLVTLLAPGPERRSENRKFKGSFG